MRITINLEQEEWERLIAFSAVEMRPVKMQAVLFILRGLQEGKQSVYENKSKRRGGMG